MEHKLDPTQKRELFQPSAIAVREGEGEEQYIEGDSIMCGVETILYEDEDFREVEIIDASCITPEFIAAQNMFLNAEHNRAKTFGRQGANLEVFPKADRLSMRCKGTSNDFKETRAKINDGVYTGMSFEFWPDQYVTEKRSGADKKTEYCVRHTKFRAIGALTVALQPAYPTTSIGVREMYREAHPEDDSQARQKQLEAEAEKARREEELAAEAAKKTRERAIRVMQMEAELDEIEQKLHN